MKKVEQNEYAEEYRLAEWVRSDEWQHIKKTLLDYITALESVNLLDDTLPNERVGEEAKVRSKAIRLVLSWIADVEGIRERQEQTLEIQKDDDILIRR
jgi:hypothetical protein